MYESPDTFDIVSLRIDRYNFKVILGVFGYYLGLSRFSNEARRAPDDVSSAGKVVRYSNMEQAASLTNFLEP
jgi:hypothetical protein